MAEKDPTEEQLFYCLANHIVGHWYRFDEDEVLIFSLAEAPASITDMIILQRGISFTALYRLRFLSNRMAYIIIAKLPQPYGRVIEVITKDTMILKEKGGRLIVYERRPNPAFAEMVINSACKKID